MIETLLLVAAAFFAGHLTAPETVQTVTVPIKVPVAMPCEQAMPERPAMPLEGLQERPSVDRWVQHARAELKEREGYERRLQAALQGCIGPPAGPTKDRATGPGVGAP